MFPLVISTTSTILSNFIETEAGGKLRDTIAKAIDDYIPGASTYIPDPNKVEKAIGLVQSSISQQTTMLSGIQSSIGALGMMSVAGCVLSAVNLYQLFKVQKSISNLEKSVNDGFIDLKVHFDKSLNNLLEEQQKRQLSQAYQAYRQGMERVKASLTINDKANRHNHLTHCSSSFEQALSIYDNPYDFQNINLPSTIRRLEACWAIQSANAEIFTLQQEYNASLHSHKILKQRILLDIEKLKTRLDSENHQFVIIDINWLYENDLKLLNHKIDFLEQKKIPQIFLSKETPQTEEIKTTLDAPQALKASQEFVDTITSSQQNQKIQDFINNQVWLSIYPNISPEVVSKYSLLEQCRLYIEVHQWLYPEFQTQNIQDITRKYQKELIKNKRVNVLGFISKDDLSSIRSTYASSFQWNEKALTLIDNSLFLGASSDGILLTDKGIYSDEYKKIPLEVIFKAEIKGDYLLINNYYSISIISDSNIKQAFCNLLNDVLAFLKRLYSNRIALLKKLERTEEEKENLLNLLSMEANRNCDVLQRLVFLGENKYINNYFKELTGKSDLNRLEELVNFKHNNEELAIKYCNYLIEIKTNPLLQHEKTAIKYCNYTFGIDENPPSPLQLLAQQSSEKLKNLICLHPNNTQIRLNYLQCLLRTHDENGMQFLLEKYPRDAEVLWAHADFLKKASNFADLNTCLIKLQLLAPEYKREEVYLMRAETLKQLERHEDALDTYQQLSKLVPAKNEYYWQQILILMRLKRHNEIGILLENLQQTEETLICRFLLAMKLQQWDEVKELGSKILESDKHPNVLQFINLIHH